MDKEQWNLMTRKAKVQWFFQYYSGIIIVGTIILIAAFYLAHSLLFPDPIDDVVVIIYCDGFSEERFLEYEEELESMSEHTVSLQMFQASDPYGSQAFAAKLGTGQTDLVIASAEEMDVMSNGGFLLSYAPIEGTKLYMGIPRGATAGEFLEQVINYLDEKLKNPEK